MTRNKTIDKMIKMAIAITGKNSDNWTRTAENAIWEMCCDWNSEHEEEEIFMCEIDTEEDGYVNGFAIEDDYFIVEGDH